VVDDLSAAIAFFVELRLEPDGHGRLGERVSAEVVGELEQYEAGYRLCFLRGPAGVIIEPAEQLG
jgi:hypothetical protein